MGSICCVPARSKSTGGSVNGCSNVVDELHFCNTNGFPSPSVSQQSGRYENPQPYARHMDTGSSSSSSRGGMDSDCTIRHGHTPSDGGFSQGASPSYTHWASLVSSRSGNFADFITLTGEVSSPSVTFQPLREEVLFNGVSPLQHKPELIGKQDEYGRNKTLQMEAGCLSNTEKGIALNRGSVDSTTDYWSARMFSELVASSQRERVRWTRARSPSDSGYFFYRKNTENVMSYPVEWIRAYSSEAVSAVTCTKTHTCGLCSQSLSDLPPNTEEVSNLAVVDVLSCGHVFHPRCLEEVTPEARKQDPPCPQCDAAEKLKAKSVPELSMPSKNGWMPGSFHSQTSSKNKLSRIVAADILPEHELPCNSSNRKYKVLLGDISEGPESFNPMCRHEKDWSRRIPFKKGLSFKGKTLKNILIGGGRKHSGA